MHRSFIISLNSYVSIIVNINQQVLDSNPHKGGGGMLKESYRRRMWMRYLSERVICITRGRAK